MAQARARHRHLLLVFGADVRPRVPDRAIGAGAALVFGIRDADDLIAFYDNGHGPLSTLPVWLQAALFLVLADFMMYWLHRMFHRGGFWKYHAIHHSSEDVDWISAARFHPVNLLLGTIGVDVVLLMAGISPNVMLWLGPFNIFHSAFVHANLNWTLGPFRYVIATPVFHRWHHTSPLEGGNTNFAGTFPLWDILFKTFRLPEGPAARSVWRGGPGRVPARNGRATGLSVPQIDPAQQIGVSRGGLDRMGRPAIGYDQGDVNAISAGALTLL